MTGVSFFMAIVDYNRGGPFLIPAAIWLVGAIIWTFNAARGLNELFHNYAR